MPAIRAQVGGPAVVPQVSFFEEPVSGRRRGYAVFREPVADPPRSGQIGAIDPMLMVPTLLTPPAIGPPPLPPLPRSRRRPPPLPPLPKRQPPPLPPLPPRAFRVSLVPPSLQSQIVQAQQRLRPASARKMTPPPLPVSSADVLRLNMLQRRQRIQDEDEDEDDAAFGGTAKRSKSRRPRAAGTAKPRRRAAPTTRRTTLRR